MDEQLQHAANLLGLRRPAQAEELLCALLARDPGDAAALRLLAEAIAAQDRREEALGPAFAAVRAEPANADGHLLSAHLLRANRRNAEALIAASEAVRLAPHDWRAHYTLGQVTLYGGEGRRKDRYRAALRCAEETIALAPTLPAGYVLAGACHDFVGAPESASHAYSEALRIDPTNTDALNGLSRARLGTGGVADAAQAVSAALAMDPQDRELHRTFRGVSFTAVLSLYLAMLPASGVAAFLIAHGVAAPVRLAVLLAGAVAGAAWLRRVNRRLAAPIVFWPPSALRHLLFPVRLVVLALPALTVAIVVLGSLPGIGDAPVLLVFIAGFCWLVANMMVAAAIEISRDLRRR
ncbi:MAG: tetratricopeptide repeat protein [Nocardioidaceae bacterium]|nr:tetratricopeptide repeat protein [Nocardioidaceae bacterium]